MYGASRGNSASMLRPLTRPKWLRCSASSSTMLGPAVLFASLSPEVAPAAHAIHRLIALLLRGVAPVFPINCRRTRRPGDVLRRKTFMGLRPFTLAAYWLPRARSQELRLPHRHNAW